MTKDFYLGEFFPFDTDGVGSDPAESEERTGNLPLHPFFRHRKPVPGKARRAGWHAGVSGCRVDHRVQGT
jgi:hypothetical protein